MPTEYDRTLLPLIDQALASPGWLPPVPRALRPGYKAERLLQCRQFNRRLLVVLTLLFDLYWVNQIWIAPELIALSGMLRFGMMTPAVLLFIALDRRGVFGRHYALCLLLLTMVPSLITAVLCVRASSHVALVDIRAMPLILLGTSMAVRMPPREFLFNMLVTPGAFIASLLFCRVLPHTELVSLSFIEICIAAAAAGFNLQLEWRDRRMFLLHTAEQIMRARLAKVNQGLMRETLTDPLTGIANRRCFEDTVALVWHQAAAEQGPVGLIMADIDYFKAYNDFYGHQAGDDCLRRVAARMAGLIRDEDMLARYGGEEFVVILPDATVEIVQAVAERVRGGVEAMALEHAGLNPPGSITLSLGLASLRSGGTASVRDLIVMADTNLYVAKRGGRNRTGAAGLSALTQTLD